MGLIKPKSFKDEDLNLQVRLDTCSDGVSIDYTGKKSYTFGLMRKGIGFGITNIDIEINASLQPIIEITFKDLYGNTLFGTQREGGALTGVDAEGETFFNKSTSIDYSVIFNWPPPKFFFTFKGYLGNPVTWILNLKKTSTNYNSSDQSFELKATFVPNQWGFFADMPIMYLLATKSLKNKYRNIDDQSTFVGPPSPAGSEGASGNGPSTKEDDETLYDLIKIGRQVEVKKQEASKEYDALINQISSYQSSLLGSINTSRLIKFDVPVEGSVNTTPIKDFKDFVVYKPGFFENAAEAKDQFTFDALNKFLVIKCTSFQGNVSQQTVNNYTENIDFEPFKEEVRKNPDKVQADFDKQMQTMSTNRDLVEATKSLSVINKTEAQLGKLTISNILSKMAGDAGYILGRILDAGYGIFDGNASEGNQSGLNLESAREDRNTSGDLIGKYFPMCLNEDREELPATSEYLGRDIGVDSFEMKFVKDFIKSVSEGIVANRTAESADASSQENVLKKRVSNAEIVKGNPYQSSYKNIASNILERSGIISFITRSNDPNRPGDYGNTTFVDNDSRGNIVSLASADMENITDQIIAGLDSENILSLKRFCVYLTNAFNEEGEVNGVDSSILQEKQGDSLNNDLLDKSYETLVSGGEREGGSEKVKVKDFITQTINGQLLGSTQSSSSLNEIGGDFNTHCQIKRIINNGVPYLIDSVNEAKTSNSNNGNEDLYYMIAFQGDDFTKSTSSSSSASDSQTDESTHDDPSGISDSEEPLGLVQITNITNEEGETLGRVEYFNDDYVINKKVYDYSVMSSIGLRRQFLNKVDGSFVEANSVDDLIYESEGPNGILENDNDIPLSFTVFYAAERTDPNEDLIWGPFLNTIEGENQRIALRSMCKTLLSKLEKEEQDRREVFGSIIGGASEYEDLVYKQFHLLFNQWNLLAFDESNLTYDKNGKISNMCNPSHPGKGVAERLEELFGGSHLNITTENDELDGGLPKNGTFRYDFPLNAVSDPATNGVSVKDALVNIEPLYKSNSNTTVLNSIQQICTKNNFIFVPIPGNAEYRNIKDIYKPNPKVVNLTIRNYFHVLFAPTPERRLYGNRGSSEPVNRGDEETAKDVQADAIVFEFGSVDNKIVKNINVSTDENKVTAESIVNLQRLVDNENQNKKVTSDCSMLPVLEGRSYKATVEMIGNAQVYPMQYFFVPRMPLFGGLYQIMKVSHSIEPNNMTTTAEGLKLLLAGKKYGGQPPITLSTLKSELEAEIKKINEPNVLSGKGPNE